MFISSTIYRIALITSCMLAGAAAHPADAAWWKPRAGTTFSIMLSVAPPVIHTPAQAVDVDLFDTRVPTIATLNRQGKHVICYLSAGSWEDWRPDRNRFPASVLGNNYDGWPGERWLDTRRISLLAPVMRARLDLCKRKGFSAVDPDNVDGYQANTGFPLTRSDSIRYLKFLAAEAHKRGLGIGLKNATEIAPFVLSHFDFAVTEDCFDQGWCRNSRNFIKADKPVFAIEYTDNGINFNGFCNQTRLFGLSPLYKKRKLDEWERRCPGR